MKIIFYNLTSITIALILMVYGIYHLKKTKGIRFSFLCFLHSILFLGVGIGGFFIPEGYEFIPILIMLILAVSMILCFLLAGKSGENPKEKRKNAH